jgi:hypothetical protein
VGLFPPHPFFRCHRAECIEAQALIPDGEQKQEQKKVPGPPPQKNGSGRAANSHDMPATGHPAGEGLVPAPTRVLGRYAKWDILPLDLSAHVPPEPKAGGLIAAHNDPGI